MTTTRRATVFDAGSMAELLNQIIAIGGTTALTDPVTGDDLKTWMAREPDHAIWYVAVNKSEQVVGFQWVEPKAKLPVDACDIGTFVRAGQTGLGVGSALFNATRAAAKLHGYGWINATIRVDNEGGLIYYQSRGFRDYGLEERVALTSGLVVDRVLKRFDLY